MWIDRTLVPPATFSRALQCRLQRGGPALLLLAGDSSIEVWERPAKSGEDGPLRRLDRWDLRRPLGAVDVLRGEDGEVDTLVTGSADGRLTFLRWRPSSLHHGIGTGLSVVGEVQCQ